MTNTQIIRNWIKRFDDQRLAEVYAFNEDGKMAFRNSCSCLLGVTLADKLHTSTVECTYGPQPTHYHDARKIPGAVEVEWAYRNLGSIPFMFKSDALKRWLLSRILRDEIQDRDQKRARARLAVIPSTQGMTSKK